MPTLYIRGETGATLNATRRTLASVNAEAATMRLAVLAPEELAWRVSSANLSASDTIIPDLGQKVSLYLDEVRLFHGHVTATEVIPYGVRVGVVGPWWWMTRQEATSDQDDQEATSAERPMLEFASGAWKDAVEGLMERAEDTYGLPVTTGTIATFNSIPLVRYQLSSLADVLTRLTQWVADAVPWWDHRSHSDDCQAAAATTITLATSASATDDAYNGLEIEIRSGANAGETREITDYDGTTNVATVDSAWTITPTAGDTYNVETKVALNVTRRGSATATTYTLGTDPVVEPLSFLPRMELEVTRVELPYAERDAETGKFSWASQAAGTTAAGKRQIIPVAGPELDSYLPDDSYETVSLDYTTTDVTTAAKAAIRGWAELVAAWPEGGSGWVFGAGDVATTRTVSRGDLNIPFPSPTSWTKTALAGTRQFIVFDGGIDPPQWLIDDYGIQEYTLNHWYFVDGETVSTTPAYDAARRAELLRVLGYTFFWNSASKSDPDSSPGSGYQWTLLFKPGVRLWTIATADIPASGIFYRKRDYSFANPPSGLAAAMLAASNWQPWEGTITRELDELSAELPFTRKYSLAGTISAASTAGALPRSYTLDLANNLATLELGPPDRLDFRTLVNRTERRGSENILDV